MPPRRERLGIQLGGTREERVLIAVSLYADRIRLWDIVEACRVNTHLIHREARRLGVALRSPKTSARSLGVMVRDARCMPFERIDDFRAAEGVSLRTAAAVWSLAHGRMTTALVLGTAPSSQLQRRCYHCGSIATDPLECPYCHHAR